MSEFDRYDVNGNQDPYRNTDQNGFYVHENTDQNSFYGHDNTGYTVRKRSGWKAALCAVLAILLLGTSAYTAISLFRNEASKVAAQKNVESVKTVSLETASPAKETKVSPEAASVEKLILGEGEIGTTAAAATASVIDVADLVEEVMPCVVSVTDNLKITTNPSYDPFSYFFGYGSQNEGSTTEQPASGSGVIIGQSDTELLIVTNNHVVDSSGNYRTYTIESTGISVAFCDGTTADVTIKGTDSQRDLAVLAVPLSEISEETKAAIKIAVIGSSDDTRVGSAVIAIGNVLGNGQSVTLGIVSAKERTVTFSNGTSQKLLQTDAAINPGNSGGGLFNMQGELIGINSAKYSDTSVEGMGFAIPLSDVSDVIEDLMNKTPVADEDKGYIGVNGETIPDSYIKNYGYPAGVSITRIAEGSPAETAGLQIYDIVTAVNGKSVASMSEMKAEINSYAAGETITISVSRPDGRGFKEMTFDVTLVRYDDLG